MKYISIEYLVANVDEGHIKSIESLLLPYEQRYFDQFCKMFKDYSIPEINVVLTDNIWRDIDKFYSEQNQTHNYLRPKGLEHLVKIVTINDITKYFWSASYFAEDTIRVFFNLMIEDLASNYLKEKYQFKKYVPFNEGLKYLFDSLCVVWHIKYISKRLTTKIIEDDGFRHNSFEDLTFAFKRNIRHIHFEFQKHQNNFMLLRDSISEVELFLTRILTYGVDTKLVGLDEFQQSIENIVNFIKISDEDLSIVDYESIHEDINLIFRKCDIHLKEDFSSKQVYFNIVDGPKKLFKELADTHPRILCFMDILGFKSLIQEYESENSSMVLKNLKRVFDSSRTGALDLILKLFDEDVREDFEVRMFSDCIMLSLPYIDFGIDVKKGFYNMILMINVFQQTFMAEGFYLRGHITVGSYYSDKNMLFSGALVEAYLNESATVYPIISVNPKLLEKIDKTTEYDDSLLTFEKMLVRHNIEKIKNNIFVNPFFTFTSFKNLDFGSVFDDHDSIFKNLGSLLKNILNNQLRIQGVGDMNEVMDKTIEIISEVLERKIEDQAKVCNNFNIQDSKRLVAYKVLLKFDFLRELFAWIQNAESTKFEYV